MTDDVDDATVVTTETISVVAFTVRLSQKDHHELRRAAYEHEGSMNGIVSSLISDYLIEHHDCPICH